MAVSMATLRVGGGVSSGRGLAPRLTDPTRFATPQSRPTASLSRLTQSRLETCGSCQNSQESFMKSGLTLCHLSSSQSPVFGANGRWFPARQHRREGRMKSSNFLVEASSAAATPSDGGDSGAFTAEDKAEVEALLKETHSKKIQLPAFLTGKGAAIAAGMLGAATIATIATVVACGGVAGVVDYLAKSGFAAAFALIFVSEIGDKTFFIAALLAMRHAQWQIAAGACSALAVMTVISVALGRLFKRVPASIQSSAPIGEYLAIAMLVYFGIRSLRDAWNMPSVSGATASSPGAEEAGSEEENDELTGAAAMVVAAERQLQSNSAWAVITETFGLIFVAEWGDRSMFATIALGAAQNPVGVACGATIGHVVATCIAILGGSLLSEYISEKQIAFAGGVLFLVFAAATLFGIF